MHCCITFVVPSLCSTTLVQQKTDYFYMTLQTREMKRRNPSVVCCIYLDIIVEQPLRISSAELHIDFQTPVTAEIPLSHLCTTRATMLSCVMQARSADKSVAFSQSLPGRVSHLFAGIDKLLQLVDVAQFRCFVQRVGRGQGPGKEPGRHANQERLSPA